MRRDGHATGAERPDDDGCNCARYERSQDYDPISEPTIEIDQLGEWERRGHCRVCGTQWIIEELSYHYPVFAWRRAR